MILALQRVIRTLVRRPDILLAVTVTCIVSMLVIPLPGTLLDPLIAVNIATALVVLLVALFAKNPLEVSTFPSILLITTLFRLGLNVSTTRGILAKADAGEVVQAFGHFVLQGDVVVGMVIFLVITLVQFLVIAKGSERVAEVAARFTLDAMPGKQMSIDAALRAGSITEEEAQTRRDDLQRGSQMYGNMDGAMKFVKGDAIAGLVITAMNLVAGLIIGIMRLGMPTDVALETYSVLTVGDGLVSQISALLITLASGVLVTRVEDKDKDKNLGFSLKEQLLGNSKVLYIGGGLMAVLSLVPGLPMFPFLLCSIFAFVCGLSKYIFPFLSLADTPQEDQAAKIQKKAEKKKSRVKKNKSASEQMSPSVVPLGVDLDVELSNTLGFVNEAHDDQTELILTYIPQLRDALYLETGVRFPGVRVRPGVVKLPPHTFMIRINDVPVLQETIPPDMCLATADPDRVKRLSVPARSIEHPITKAKMSLIRNEYKAVVEAAGINVWSPTGMVSLYMASVLRARSRDFIGLQEGTELVDRLERGYPALVKEVIPKVVSVPQLVDVLKRLVDEGVSIRDMKTIVEAVGEFGARDPDSLFLTEKVRSALSAQLAHAYAGLENRLHVMLLDQVIEETIAGSITQDSIGHVLTLEPELTRKVITSIAAALQPMVAKGKRPVILTHPKIRRFIRKIMELDLPQVAVLSFEELPPTMSIQPMGRAQLPEAA